MAGKELYNIDLNINVNGVDEASSKLKKVDKDVENLEKKAKKGIKIKFDTSSMNKMTGQTSKAVEQMAKGYSSTAEKIVKSSNTMSKKVMKNTALMRKVAGIDASPKKFDPVLSQSKLTRVINSDIKRMNSLSEAQKKMSTSKMMFRNNTLDMMMGKAINFGGASINIKATENVTQTVAKAQSSMQKLKFMDKVKVSLSASGNRALQVINQTREKAKAYANGKYEALLTAKDKLSGTVFNRAGGMISRGIGRITRMASYGMSALGGVGVVSLIKTYASYEKQMSSLRAVTDVTAKEFAQLDRQARQLGATTEWSATQVAQGMTELGQAGFNQKEIMYSMPGLLNLASAGGLQLAEASSIASGTLRAFNLEASKTGHVADVLALAASATNAEVADMGNSMEYAAPYAKSLNVSLEDTAAAIGMLSQVNIKGSKAGMALRGMFTALSAPTAAAKKVMEQYGFNAFDATGKMKPFPQVIKELDGALKHLNPQQKGEALNKMFGDVAGGGVQALLGLGSEKLEKLSKDLNFADGAAKKMAATRMDNLTGDFILLKSAVEGMYVNLGKKLEPYLRQFVQWLTSKIPEIEKALGKMIDYLGNNWESILSGFKTAIPLVLGFMGAIQGLRGILFLGDVVRDFGILKEVLFGLSGATGSATGLLSGLKGMIAGLGVTGGIFAVVAALGIMSVAISDNIDLIADLNSGLGELGTGISGVMEVMGGLFKLVLGSAGTFLGGSFKMFDALFSGDWEKAGVEASQMFADLKTNGKNALGDLFATSTYAYGKIRESSEKELSPVKKVFETALGQQKNIVAGNYKEMSKAVSSSMKGLSDDQISILKGTSRNMEQLLFGVNSKMSENDMASRIAKNMDTLSKMSGFDPKHMNEDFNSAIKTIEKNAGSASKNIKTDLSNAFNSFKELASSGNIQGGVSRMLEDINKAGPALQSFISSNKSAMQGMFKGVDFSKDLQSQISAVMANIGKMEPSQAIGAMRSLFSVLGSEANAAGQQAGQQYSSGVQSGMSSGGATNQSSPIANVAQNQGQQAYQSGVQTGQMYGQGINAGVQQAQAQQPPQTNNAQVQQAQQMAQQVKQAYSDMYNGAGNSVSQLQSRTSSAFSALSSSATSQVSSMCSRIISLWNAMKATVSSTVTARFVLSVSTVGAVGAIPHADGGILTRPHLGLVAEAGPEAVIPLSPGKRARGIELFKQAGKMLGITNDDGNANPVSDFSAKDFNTNNNVKTSNSQSGGVNVSVSVNVNVNDKESIISEAKEEFGRELEEALSDIS